MDKTSATAPKPRMATMKDASGILNVSICTVYRMVERGQLETVTIGRRRLIRMTSIEALTGEAA